jgi:hypothetical protein
MTIVLHRHLRELGYCNRGSREWFARKGLDWADFLEHGIEADKLMATQDAMAAKVCEHAERAGNGGQ